MSYECRECGYRPDGRELRLGKCPECHPKTIEHGRIYEGVEMNKQERIPYMVQRIKKHREPNAHYDGVDRRFIFDYMGSSEFEYGSVPWSLKLMRWQDELVIKPLQTPSMVDKGWALTFYGRSEDHEMACRMVEGEITREADFIERPHILLSLKEDEFAKRIIGWWAIQHERNKEGHIWKPFLVFKYKEDAEMWQSLM